MKAKRLALSKRVRFEVFKRDSFKCQYCGRSAPDVVLNVDHIHPVAEGGESDITNLITSCFDCNSGKSDKVLSDDSAAQKRKAQLDLLQERREQLEMMSEWQMGLLDLGEVALEKCESLWSQVAVGFSLNESGRDELRKLIRKFGVPDVMHAIQVAAKYISTDRNGDSTKESVELAWKKVGGICVVEVRNREDPELKEVYKLRSHLRSKFNTKYGSDSDRTLLSSINELRMVGYSMRDIQRRAATVERYWPFIDLVEKMIAEAQ